MSYRYRSRLFDNGERDEHNVYLTGAQPSYTLAELSNNLDLYLYDIKKNPAANDSGYGRNCSTFYGLCPYGYALAGSSYSEIVRQLQPIADNINNNYDVPMQYGEVKHIVRSIARYCARMNFSESHKRFSELQAVRGARGGKVSKRPPVKTSESTTKPWLELNISRATYYRHKKNKWDWISHNQIIALLHAMVICGKRLFVKPIYTIRRIPRKPIPESLGSRLWPCVNFAHRLGYP